MVAKDKKVAYFAHLTECLNKYQRAFIVNADFVGSKQISDIRIALRGKAELIFGKNTMVRRCIRDLTSDGSHPEWAAIVPVMKGNLGFMFTNGDLAELQTVVDEYVKPAAAKAGVIAPVDCVVPKGPTGLDPAQTSFFQALNIATKINKGAIEIINDCKVLTEGTKVGTSEAALLTKLNVKPFSIESCIDLSLEMQSIKANNKQLVLNYCIAPNVPQRLLGDDMRIRQIVTNLISNAVKFTPKGSVELKIRAIAPGEDVSRALSDVKHADDVWDLVTGDANGMKRPAPPPDLPMPPQRAERVVLPSVSFPVE